MKKGILALAVIALTSATIFANPLTQPGTYSSVPKGMVGKIQSMSGQRFVMRSASGHNAIVMINSGTQFAPMGYGMSHMTVGQSVWMTGSQIAKGKYMASGVTNMGGWNMWMTMKVDSVGSNNFTVEMMMDGGMMGNDQRMTVTVTSSTQWNPGGYSPSAMQPGDWVQITGTMSGWYALQASSVTKTDDSNGGGCGGGGMGGGMKGH